MEEQKRLVRYFVLLVFFLILFVELINLASSTITIRSPIAFGNYSTTMNISITSAEPHLNSSRISYNVTLYCNKSGGSVETRPATDIVKIIWNATETAVFFENATASISSLTDALRLYNCTAYADNSTNSNAGNWSVSVRNITIDNTPPNVSFTPQTNTINNGNYSGAIILNVSVNDSIMGVDSVYFNITNSSGVQVNWTRAINSSNLYYNITLDTTAFADGKYNVTVYANDTQLNNLNKTERIQITIDNTAPTATFSCSPSTVNIGYPVTCSCSGSAASGVLTTAFTASPSTVTAGTFTETCNVTNYVGNSTTATATYTVSYSGGSVNTGGGGVSKTDTNSWTKITPGVAVIMKDFDKDIGVKQIQIEVNNVAQNVQIIVNKYNSKPANVTVEKSSTYQYLSVTTKNLANNLSRAIIESQVNKSWILSRNFNKTDIALFKYDESSNKWNELPTTFKEEDSNYYYYDTLVTSFSYFAIAPKETTPVTTGEPETQLEEQQEAPWKLSTWIWGAIVLIVVAGGIVLFFLLKKKRRKVK